jgi:hypothetical protein
MDNGSGPFYLALSGWMGLLGFIGVIWTTLRKYNCEVHGCPRIGRHGTAAGHTVCRRHHPDGAPTHAHILRAHRAAVRARESATDAVLPTDPDA